jgi:hypothetical protein
MNKVTAWLKSIRLDRVLTVAIVGLLLVVSTACSSVASAKTADEVRPEVPGDAVTSQYKGGMNNYSDVDPRQNIQGAQAKAKGLVDNARRNIEQKSVDSPEQYVENYRSGTPLGERVRRIGEDVGNAAENVKEDAAKGTRENLRGVKEAGRDAAYNAQQSARETADAAQSKVKSDVRTAQKAVDRATDENLGEKIIRTAQDAADKVKDALD